MSGKAAGVGVLRVDVGGAGDVAGLDVEEREGLRSVKTAQHDVRSVCEASAGAGHPLLQGAASVRALSVDGLRAEESVDKFTPGLFTPIASDHLPRDGW